MKYLLIAVLRLKGRTLTKVVTHTVPAKDAEELSGEIRAFETLLNCSSSLFFKDKEETEKIISMVATPIIELDQGGNWLTGAGK